MDEFIESQNPPPHGDNMPEQTVSELANALKRTVEENYSFVRVRRLADALREQTRVLDSVSYERVLARGFSLVTKADGSLVRSAAGVAEGDALRLKFADGEVAAVAGQTSGGPGEPPAPKAAPAVERPRIKRRTTGGDQGSLF